MRVNTVRPVTGCRNTASIYDRSTYDGVQINTISPEPEVVSVPVFLMALSATSATLMACDCAPDAVMVPLFTTWELFVEKSEGRHRQQ